MQSKMFRMFAGVLAAVILVSLPLSAQSISGLVTDTSSAAVSNATVVVKNTGTGTSQTVTTDAAGRYNVPELGIGDYELTTAMAGFQTVVRKGIALNTGSQLVVDVQLPVGQAQTTVTVEGAVTQVDTQSTAVGTLVEAKQMRDLPLNGRNFTQLLTLQPGVTQIPQGAPGAGSTFYGNGQKYSIAGSRPSGQAYLLDGQDMVNFWNNGPGAGGLGTALGVEAIAEFLTLTNTYSTQFGGNGAVINATSRSGTNAFHGSLYEFLRNNKLEARNFFDANRPPFRQNQFGASLGGPVIKDKAFFFANYEGLRIRKTNTNVVTVPDLNARNFTLPTGAVTENANPQVRQAIRDTLALYPTTGIFRSLGGGLAQATVNSPQNGGQNYVLSRFDYTLSERSSLNIRYVNDRANRNFATNIPYWDELDRTRNHFLNIEERQVFSPTLVNVFRAGLTRTYEDAFTSGSPVVAGGVARPSTIAEAGNHPLQFFGTSAGRQDGSVAIGGGVTTIGATNTLPFYLVPNKFQVGDDIIWTSGAHNIKAGGNVMRMRENTWAPFIVGGRWNFSNLQNFLQGTGATLDGQVADFQNPTADATKDYRYTVFAFYAEDQWKLNRKLTLNMGVRYSPTTSIKQVRHLMMNIVNAPFGPFVPTSTVTARNTSLRNWDPRVGLAWDPSSDHKTSIRASFGMFHNVLYSRDTNHWLQPPFLTGLQTTAQGLEYLGTCSTSCTPFRQLGAGSSTVTVPTNGSLTVTNGNYYGVHSTPYQMQWNFNIQREIMANTIATFGYVGSRNLKLFAQRDFNYPVPYVGVSGRPTFSLAGTNTANPRLNPQYSALNLADNIAASNYNGMQMAVNRRFAGGWQMQFGYTFSKSIDNASGTYGLDGGGTITNPIDFNADRGLSNFNRKHNFRLSGVWALPYHGKGALGKVFGDWQLTGVYTYLSGSPFDPLSANNRVHNSQPANSSRGRPDVIAGCQLQNDVTPQQAVSGQKWFNPSCYALQPIGTFGNAGRGTLIGPNLWNLDSSLLKDIRFSETRSLQFRAEGFNIMNHASFQNPQNQVFTGTAINPNAGVVSATNSQPRQVQLALKFLF